MECESYTNFKMVNKLGKIKIQHSISFLLLLLTNYQKFSGLKQHPVTISVFVDEKPRHSWFSAKSLTRPIQVIAGLPSFLEVLGEMYFPLTQDVGRIPFHVVTGPRFPHFLAGYRLGHILSFYKLPSFPGSWPSSKPARLN